MALLPNIQADATGQSGLSFPQTSSNPLALLNSIIPIISQMKNNSVANTEQEQAYSSDLSLKNAMARQKMASFGQQPNVQFKDNNPDITPLQQADLGIRQTGEDVKNQELKNTLGNTAFNQNLETKKLDLETLKNKQIYDTKQQDLQRKVDDSNQKLSLATQKLQQNQNDAATRNTYHQAQLDALNAKHDLDMSAKQRQMDETQRMHDAQIADLKGKADRAAGSTTTTETSDYDAAGNPTKKTTTTQKGQPKKRVNVTGPNGPDGKPQQGTIEEGDDLPQGWSLDSSSGGGGD